MSGDYSRYRFDPRDSFSGVRMQQGRVQLDADWNEWTDAIDRRARAEAVDTFGVSMPAGIAGVAVVSPQTPDAFLIEVSGGGITIGPGRMYVDGLLAENFGDFDGPLDFDGVLAELRGQNPIGWADQPWHPAAGTLPGGGPHLAYLEVWDREVTHLQRPDLVETAIGVDTTTRSQTVWQVRLLQNVGGGVTCSSPDADLGAAWAAIIAPSAGRMSSRDVGVPPDEDPCELPPSGGYRGLENQLYRIEIHDGGAAGTATFKWSRDNASVGATVVEVLSAGELRLASLGRDSVLRFNTGDWVEIIDDRRELSGEAGDPARRVGEIRRITVDDASQTIAFAPALPADLIPTGSGDDTLEQRHLRVVRWDQRGVVRDDADNVIVDLDAPGSTGLIPVPAGGAWVTLEKGVQVRFSLDPTAGVFRCNEFWTVAARTADASAETLDNAPARGIHRHFARLALVTFPDDETDCRRHWPPATGGGCCTVVVEPGEDIQAAIDSLPEAGGCVCIRTGLHEISAPLRIGNSNVVVHGESPGARVRRDNGASVLVVESADGSHLDSVAVQGIRFETAPVPGEGDPYPFAMVYSNRCRQFRLQECVLAPDSLLFLAGLWLGGQEDSSVEGCAIGPVGMGVWVAGDSTRLAFLDNAIEAAFLDSVDAGSIGIWVEDAYGPVRIERNRIRNFMSGVYVNSEDYNEPPSSQASGSTIRGNHIRRDSGAGGLGLEDRVWGIDCAAHHASVVGNVLVYESTAYGGIRATGRDVRVEDNVLGSKSAPASDSESPLPIGIQLGFAGEGLTVFGERGLVRGNRLNGAQDAIVAFGANRAGIADNRIVGGEEANARIGIATAGGQGIEISCNVCQRTAFPFGLLASEDCSLVGNQADDGRLGVLALAQTGLTLRGNRFVDQRNGGIMIGAMAGATALVENRIENCGYQGLGSIGAFGIFALSANGKVHIESCDIVDTGLSPDLSQMRQPAVGIFGLFLLECLIQGNRVTYLDPLLERNDKAEDRALWLIGALEWTMTERIRLGYAAQVVDNTFTGPGMSHLVEFQELPADDTLIRRFERVIFSNNHCWHWSVADRSREGAATVSLRGRRAIVMGNHVKANSSLASFNFNGMTGIYIGNDADGHVTGFADFPVPLGNFNR